jgi:hypothetical protein
VDQTSDGQDKPPDGQERPPRALWFGHSYGDVTALLVIDPYNDFISESGKFWGRLKAVAEANGRVQRGAEAGAPAASRSKAPRSAASAASPSLTPCTSPSRPTQYTVG